MKKFLQIKAIAAFVILLTILCFQNCTVSKRSYRKGYHVEWLSKKNKTENRQSAIAEKSKKAIPLSQETIEVVKENRNQKNEDISVTSDLKAVSPLNLKRPLLSKNDECGDVITMKNGETVKAKVIEVGVSEIKYKRCDNIDGPLIVVSKKNVYSIKYTNGSEDHFFNDTVDKAKIASKKKETHPLAIATIACAAGILLLGVIPAIAGLIIAPIAKRKILAQPDKYTGLELVEIGRIICLVALIITIVVLLFVLAILMLLI